MLDSRHCFRTLAIAVAALVLGACASDPPPAPGVLDAGGPDALDPSQAYPAIVAAIDEGEASEQAFAVRSGEHEGETGVRAVRRDDAGRAVVSWTIEGEDEPLNQSVLERADDGGLVVVRMPNRERDVVTRFEPPFVHFPPELARDEPFEQDLRMLVADFDEPDRVNRRGDSTSTLTLLGGARVTVDGRDVVAGVTRAELVSTFGPARVTRTTDRWLVPGEGLVAESWTEVVRVAGFVSERREQEIRRQGVTLVEAPDDED